MAAEDPPPSPSPFAAGPAHPFSSSAPPPRNRHLSRAATFNDSPSAARRRSSILSDYSLDDARQSFRSSTEDVLLPAPKGSGAQEVSNWHSVPLAFALLPALGGMLFKNGGAVVTDIMLLGLAGVFLNWSIRLPWEWYLSSQSIRVAHESAAGDVVVEESDEDLLRSTSDLGVSSPTKRSGGSSPEIKSPAAVSRAAIRDQASLELQHHELLALAACFLFPLLGAYLLHAIRAQLSRPSEGLISNFNLTIFILASELRPAAHLVKIVRARTLFLQRIVNENPYEESEKLGDLAKRVEDLENKTANSTESVDASPDRGKEVLAEVRRNVQPELDALNRAVRRYEKRATLQSLQVEARLVDLDNRLRDTLSLAAAAAQSNRQSSISGILFEWLCAAVVVPFEALWSIVMLPAMMLRRLIGLGRRGGPTGKEGRKGGGGGGGRGGGKAINHGRPFDRLQGKGLKSKG